MIRKDCSVVTDKKQTRVSLESFLTSCYLYFQTRQSTRMDECWYTAWVAYHDPAPSSSPTSCWSTTTHSTMPTTLSNLRRATLHPTSTSWVNSWSWRESDRRTCHLRHHRRQPLHLLSVSILRPREVSAPDRFRRVAISQRLAVD